mmetsp:Transcript_1142/g.3780  ORF Transcript_1142/g.3780 Transcript_1142/m.3780 type:complete len:141 (-) Transcript_1142:1367-1789(-)
MRFDGGIEVVRARLLNTVTCWALVRSQKLSGGAVRGRGASSAASPDRGDPCRGGVEAGEDIAGSRRGAAESQLLRVSAWARLLDATAAEPLAHKAHARIARRALEPHHTVGATAPAPGAVISDGNGVREARGEVAHAHAT